MKKCRRCFNDKKEEGPTPFLHCTDPILADSLSQKSRHRANDFGTLAGLMGKKKQKEINTRQIKFIQTLNYTKKRSIYPQSSTMDP